MSEVRHGQDSNAVNVATAPLVPCEALNQVELDEELNAFREIVQRARLTRSEDLIMNSSHRHAAVLIEELFRAATSRVRILCENLNPEVYGLPAVLDAAEEFLSKDRANLKVLIQVNGALDQPNPFVERFSGRPNVRLDQLQRAVPLPYNFMLVDDIALRLEPDATGGAGVGEASFNWPRMARTLSDLFRVFWSPRPSLA